MQSVEGVCVNNVSDVLLFGNHLIGKGIELTTLYTYTLQADVRFRRMTRTLMREARSLMEQARITN